MSKDARQPIYYDSHMHTPLCKHAVGHPVEYARIGKSKRLKGIIMTCHSPMPDGFSSSVRMAPEEFPDYVELVESATREMDGVIEVKLGLESDWFPGMESWLAELHCRAEFHYILGSVHPFIKEYKDIFFDGDPIAFQRRYFGHLADAAESGLFDCLSHPDIVKVMFAKSWNFSAGEDAVTDALRRISATGIAMELNTSGINKAYPEMNPGPEMLKMIGAFDIPVVVSSDAHRAGRVAADFDDAFTMLERAGFTEVSFFNERKRSDVLIDDVRSSMVADK
ncbi:MAG: histidinol-phosphatase [Verrucomicrobiales bacterium]